MRDYLIKYDKDIIGGRTGITCIILITGERGFSFCCPEKREANKYNCLGYNVTQPQDQFCKKTGKDIAFGRACEIKDRVDKYIKNIYTEGRTCSPKDREEIIKKISASYYSPRMNQKIKEFDKKTASLELWKKFKERKNKIKIKKIMTVDEIKEDIDEI